MVWNPPHREAIAIEPYTCVVTAFDVEERGYDSGLRVLDPGKSDTLRLAIELVTDDRTEMPVLPSGERPEQASVHV